MRDSLTVLAIVLIVLLTAALVGPYFIDWSAHRAAIEAKLSEAAGVRVVISGPIDLKLLPQPTVKLAQISITGGDPGRQQITAASLDVEVSLPALMRGDIEVTDATLRSPHLELTLAESGGLPFPAAAVPHPDRVRFQHLTIRDGTVTINDARRGSWSFSGIDLVGDAASLFGPFKAEGQFGGDADPHPFRLASGTFDGTRLRVKLGLDGKGRRPAVDIDGSFLRGGAPGGGAKVRAAPSFEGTLTVAGSLPLPDSPAFIPWRLSGQVVSDGTKAVASDLEFRAGTDMRALFATGTGEADDGGGPGMARLRLHGGQLDVDALAVAPENQSIAPPKGADLLARLVALANDPDGLGTLPFGLDLDLGLDTASVAAQTLSDIKARVALGKGPAAKIAVSAAGPEGARLALDGIVEPGPAAVFRGHADAAAREVPRLAAWLEPILPQAASWMKRFLPVRSLSFAGNVEASAIGGIARDVTLALDRSTLSGAMSYTRSVGAERARVFADLSSDSLDLDGIPNLAGAAAALGEVDLSVALAARTVQIARGALSAVDVGRIDLRFSRTGSNLRLDDLTADLGSAKVTASGGIEGKQAHAEMRVEAARLDTLGSLVERLYPNSALAWLRDRGPALSPAALTLRATATMSADGVAVPTSLQIEAVAHDTHVAAEIRPDKPEADADPLTTPLSATFSADGSETGELLQQLGANLRSATAVGPSRIKGTAHGSFAGGFELAADATLGSTALTFAGKAKPELGSGKLAVKGMDLGPLLRALGVVPVSGTQVLPLEASADLSWHDTNVALRRLSGRLAGTGVSGDLNVELGSAADLRRGRASLFGALTFDRLPLSALFALGLGSPPPPVGDAVWAAQPFGPPTAVLPRSEVTLKIGTLALAGAVEAQNASLTLRSDAGAVTLADFTGTLEGGNLGGALTLRRDGTTAALAGRITWTDLAVPISGLTGRTGGTLDLAGTGTSPSALVGSLAGSGSLNLTDFALANSDPEAMARTSAALDHKALTDPNGALPEADEVARSLAAELERGRLALGDATGSSTLALGVLRAGPLRRSTASWSAQTAASIDLRTLDVDLRTTLDWVGPGAGAKGDQTRVAIALKGPLLSPAREVDASAFVNALQARAIARDQERIEVLQQDMRERAFFNRRLKAIEADQQAARDRAKAEADAIRSIEAETGKQRQLEDTRRLPEPAPAKPRENGSAQPDAGGAERRAPLRRAVPGSGGGGSKPLASRPPQGPSDAAPAPNGTAAPPAAAEPPQSVLENRATSTNPRVVIALPSSPLQAAGEATEAQTVSPEPPRPAVPATSAPRTMADSTVAPIPSPPDESPGAPAPAAFGPTPPAPSPAAEAALSPSPLAQRPGKTPGIVFRDCPTCPELVVIPAGSFEMGATDISLARPPHRVQIPKAFALGRYAVTFAEWDKCAAAGACKNQPNDHGWGRGERPVIDISWVDATAYVEWLSKVSAHRYRLPSEAEWEYAARAGTATPFWWGDEVGTDHANCSNCGKEPARATQPVGSFPPNAFGLFDMAGNVAEWVQDCWTPSYSASPKDGSADTTGDCGKHVLRGGSFRNDAGYLRSAFRFYYGTAVPYYTNGFRVARDLP